MKINTTKIALRAAQEAAKQAGKKQSGKIRSGKYCGSVTVKVDFILNKGKNYTTAPTVNLLSKAVLAKAMVYAGIQSGNFMKYLRWAATDALKQDIRVGCLMTDEDARVESKLDAMLKNVISKLPRQKREGEVSVKSTAVILQSSVRRVRRA